MGKKIEFIELAVWTTKIKPLSSQEDYKHIELILQGDENQYDLMLAYNDVETKNIFGMAYWGNWNDGNR